MGLLTDFFLAGPYELARLDLGRGPRVLPMVPAKRVDPVKLSALDAILTGTAGRLPVVIREASEEGPWVVALARPLRDALAGLAGPALSDVARRWAETEDWREDEGDPEALAALLGDLASLAARGQREEKELYVWIAPEPPAEGDAGA